MSREWPLALVRPACRVSANGMIYFTPECYSAWELGCVVILVLSNTKIYFISRLRSHI